MDFHPVAKVADLPEGEVQRFEMQEDAIAVVNLGNGEFSALADVCPHMGAWLSQGEVDVARGTIKCPWHRSVFDLRTGQPLSGPAASSARIRPTRVAGDQLMVGAGESKAAGDRKRATSPTSATRRAAVRSPTPGNSSSG